MLLFIITFYLSASFYFSSSSSSILSYFSISSSFYFTVCPFIMSEAKLVWGDNLDGFFCVMDSCLNWRTVRALYCVLHCIIYFVLYCDLYCVLYCVLYFVLCFYILYRNHSIISINPFFLPISQFYS